MIYLKPCDKFGLRILGGCLAAILLPLMARSETSRTVLREDFESFRTTKALRAAWPGGPAQLVTNAPGGGHCISHDGTGMNRRGGFFVFPDATHNVVFEADFYDFGTNAEQNVTVTLNAEDTHENVVFGFKAPHGYMARVGGTSAVTNSVPFKRGQEPIQGWHHFRGVVTTTNFIASVDFGRDGKIDHTVQIPFNKPPPTYTQLRFGGYANKLAAGAPVLLDNIRLELVTLDTPTASASVVSGPTNQAVPVAGIDSAGMMHSRTNELLSLSASANRSNISDVASDRLPTVPSTNSSETAGLHAMETVHTNQSRSASAGAAGESQPVPFAVWWIGGALGLIIALLGVLILMLRRHTARHPRALLVDGSLQNGVAAEAMVVAGNGHEQWRERALQAEAVAAKQAQILKDKVGPELVQFAKETLVQGLYNQRNALLKTQAQARQTLTELENRLSELKLPSQERVIVYEKRIAELEKQLESRNDEMRELTRATLLLVQEKLVEERQSQKPRFN